MISRRGHLTLTHKLANRAKHIEGIEVIAGTLRRARACRVRAPVLRSSHRLWGAVARKTSSALIWTRAGSLLDITLASIELGRPMKEPAGHDWTRRGHAQRP